MVRNGNYDAMMTAGTKQAEASPVNTDDMNAQLQAALEQAQQAGQINGLSPEMQAQMAAAMAQVQQAMAASDVNPKIELRSSCERT